LALLPSSGSVFVLLVIGGLGSAALHPVGTTIAGSQASNATLGVGLFTAGGMVGFALGPVLILYLVSSEVAVRRQSRRSSLEARDP
jgi:MFS transporter, FSR family, fosmidomycin resistance protein